MHRNKMRTNKHQWTLAWIWNWFSFTISKYLTYIHYRENNFDVSKKKLAYLNMFSILIYLCMNYIWQCMWWRIAILMYCCLAKRRISTKTNAHWKNNSFSYKLTFIDTVYITFPRPDYFQGFSYYYFKG